MFDLGWFILFLFLIFEIALVLLLVTPMPSNAARGAVVTALVSVWEKQQAVRYVAITIGAINVIYFLHVVDALRQPFYAFGFLLEDAFLTCELRAQAFERERNAYITGFAIFLFLVLRRMVDIQSQLFRNRDQMKAVEKQCALAAVVLHRHPVQSIGSLADATCFDLRCPITAGIQGSSTRHGRARMSQWASRWTACTAVIITSTSETWRLLALSEGSRGHVPQDTRVRSVEEALLRQLVPRVDVVERGFEAHHSSSTRRPTPRNRASVERLADSHFSHRGLTTIVSELSLKKLSAAAKSPKMKRRIQ